MTLSQKERQLLEDLKSKEQLCIDKYTRYSCAACDGELKALFGKIANVESGHLNTIDSLLSGSMPQMNSGANASGSSQSQTNGNATYKDQSAKTSECYKNDSYLCSDLLDTEKHVSAVYNTCIFEFKDTAVRGVLNHIQKEEQEHGEQIYKYLEKNGMYS